MDFLLVLGEVVFEEFEVPDSIKGGGKQALAIHKYPGGLRTIDTTGPDDNSLTWSGYFEDELADIRCQQIDTMRRQGLPVQLVWASHVYLVVIESFEWDFRRFYHIPYSISLAVIQDLTQPGSSSTPNVEGQINSDISDALSSANGFVAGVASGLASSIATVQNTIATVASLANAPAVFFSAVQGQISQATAIARGVMDYTDIALSSAGIAINFSSGTPPETMIANVNLLNEQASAAPLAFDAVTKLTRADDNVVALSGSDLANKLDNTPGSFTENGVTYGPIMDGP